jgi:hypothetical protein
MKNESDPRSADYREQARTGLRQGDMALAEQAYAHLLEIHPDDLEALLQLARIQLAHGAADRAIELLVIADRAHPGDAVTLHQLGVARMTSGDFRGAVADLRRGLEIAPSMFVARLRLGMLLDQLGEKYDALTTSFMAINAAQAHGRWLSDETTAPEYRDAVKSAMQYVNLGRHDLFDAVLEPLRQRYGKSELVRVEQCIAIYLGEQEANLPDSRQRPKFLYFPGVPSQPYYPRERFPWLAELEANTAAILDALPLAHVREHSPETLYSVLQPGTHILPHRGVTNTRLVTHLPLIVPSDCALRVGGEIHEWQEGRCVTFDDTYEHEAWNNSAETRVVLILDTWNPDLSEAERAAVADLVGAIGDFNRASDVVTPKG